MSHYGLPVRRACELIKQSRSTQRYCSAKDPGLDLRNHIREIAGIRIRYGYRRIRVSLQHEGWLVGRNQTYRLHCAEQLQLRSRQPKWRKMTVSRQEKFKPTKPNQAWSMDFVADQLAIGDKFRALTIVGVITKEALAIEVGQSLRGEDVVTTLNRLVAQRPAPKYLFVDNGSEFTVRLLDLWAYHHRAKIDFSRPGKPTDSTHVEIFNGSFRDECLNCHWFTSPEDAKIIIEAWRRDFNESRPRSTLRDLSPAEFARQSGLESPRLCF